MTIDVHIEPGTTQLRSKASAASLRNARCFRAIRSVGLYAGEALWRLLLHEQHAVRNSCILRRAPHFFAAISSSTGDMIVEVAPLALLHLRRRVIIFSPRASTHKRTHTSTLCARSTAMTHARLSCASQCDRASGAELTDQPSS